jgi:hypothetical protein
MINTANIDMIGIDTQKEQVSIVIFLSGVSTPVPLAYLKSQKAAKKFISIFGKLIKTNVKCIDVQLLASQCDNDPESEV